MEDIEIINLWKSYDKKLEECLLFNRENAEQITHMKVRSFLSSMKPVKIVAILLGILWVGFVDALIINLFHVASPIFLISAGIQALLSTFAVGVYVYQLVLIHQVDISESVLATQEKLGHLKASTMWIVRFLLLQLPVWTTFYWTSDMFENGNAWLWALQIAVTLSFAVASIWFFLNINYENRNKRWFRLIFNGKEWNPIVKSMELLSQIGEYRIEK